MTDLSRLSAEELAEKVLAAQDGGVPLLHREDREARRAEADAALAELVRRASERDAAVQRAEEAETALRELDTALAVLEACAEKIGDEWVEEYRWKTGPYHRILALRPHILPLAAVYRRSEAEVARLRAALERIASPDEIVGLGVLEPMLADPTGLGERELVARMRIARAALAGGDSE